jgi:hypothetical protein
MQAPYLRDADNIGYLVDPASTSVLNAICAGGSCSDYLTHDGSYLRTNGDFRVTNTFYNDGTAYSRAFYDADNGNYYVDPNAGSRVYLMQPDYSFNGLVYDYNNAGYYVDPNSTSRLNYGVYDNVYSYGWMQAPIIYDTDNTGYYLDPASGSNMNLVYANDVYIRATGKWASVAMLGSSVPSSHSATCYPSATTKPGDISALYNNKITVGYEGCVRVGDYSGSCGESTCAKHVCAVEYYDGTSFSGCSTYEKWM